MSVTALDCKQNFRAETYFIQLCDASTILTHDNHIKNVELINGDVNL